MQPLLCGRLQFNGIYAANRALRTPKYVGAALRTHFPSVVNFVLQQDCAQTTFAVRLTEKP